MILLFLVFVTLAGARQCVDEGLPASDKGSKVTLEIEGIGLNASRQYVYSGDALKLVKKDYKVRGLLSVSCIEDVCQGRDYVWMFYVNGQLMNKAPKHYKVRRGDIISYKLEKI